MKKILLLLMLLINLAGYSQTTYYVSNTGDDANTGLSPAQAWKTVSKVNNTVLSPGDSVLFGAGGTWREELDITQSGTSSAWIVYSRYGTGVNPRIVGSNVAFNWTATGTTNIWQSSPGLTNPFDDTGYEAEIFFIDANDSTSWGDNQTYSSDFANLTSEFDWTFNNGTFYVYAPSDPDTRYNRIEVPQRRQCVRLTDNDPASYHEINGIDMKYAQSRGFYAGYPARNAIGEIFRNLTVGYIGYKGADRGYGLSVFHSGFLVENCHFSDCGRRAISFNLYLSVAYADRRIISNVVIRNNTFERGYHTTSLDLSSEGDRSITERPDTVSHVYFYHNIIDDSEILMTGEDATSNSLFAQRGGIILKDIYIVDNLFIGATARNILLEYTDSNYVWSNTIIGHNSNISISPYSNVSFNYSTNIDYRNNILYENLPDNSLENYGVLMQHTPSNYTQKDYNLFWEENINANRGFNGGLDGYYDVTHWSSYKSDNPTREVHSPIPANPNFINYSSGNYRLQESSAANGAGVYLTKIITDIEGETDTIGKYDLDGKLRNSTSPSIGAYEYGTFSPILVTSITVYSVGDVHTITTNKGTLSLYTVTLPTTATDTSKTWSIIPGTGTATINDGLVTAQKNGTVTARATANDASGLYDDFVITISGQTTTTGKIMRYKGKILMYKGKIIK